jgi:tetratricopeptide (TPR) repeat protein
MSCLAWALRPENSRLVILGIVAAVLPLSAALAYQEPPEELRGEITAVTGERIHIKLSQQEWLPRAGVPVTIGQEMAGMWAPLDGDFVIIQVNADSVIAQATGPGPHGPPGRGMQARIESAYPNRPQTVSDYLAPDSDPAVATIRSVAETGDATFQHSLGTSYMSRGDHDNALVWLERAQAGATDRFILAQSAVDRAQILAIRGQAQEALQILQDAARRTEPASNELVFSNYSSRTGGDVAMALEWHELVLERLGQVYRVNLENIAEANRWFRAAAELKGQILSNGAPAPSDPTHDYYLMLVNDLASLYELALEDQESAIPWLQTAARAGETDAQEKLTRLGISW